MKKIIISGLILVAVFLGLWFFYSEKSGQPDKTIEIGDVENCLTLTVKYSVKEEKIRQACEKEKAIAGDPNNYPNYINVALDWKSLGDNIPSDELKMRAIKIYTMANEKFEAKYLTSWNLAQMYTELKDYINAEKYFKIAIENNNIDAEPYTALAQLYNYNLKKDKEFIVNYYKESLKIVSINRILLELDYAKYLEEAGEYQLALEQYQELAKKDSKSYVDIINELKSKIK